MIPSNLRVPFIAVEFDPSRAFQGASILSYQALLTGQITAGGSKSELVLDRITSPDQAGEYYGVGSQLHRMFIKWFENNTFTEVYGMGIDDDDAGVAATGTATASGAATADGTVPFMFNGILVQAAVADLDDATAIGDSIAAAINAKTELPVTAANVAGVVTFTAKNDGENGNDIDFQINFNDGESLPPGVSIALVPMASGATNPDVSEIIAVLGDEWYNVIAMPWYDATNLTAMETEMASRFGAMRMIDGVVFISKKGTLSELSSFGNTRNSPHVSCPNSHKLLNTPEEFAAANAGQAAAEASIDPARPFQTLPLYGVVAPKVVDRFTIEERNSLLQDGIATYKVDSGGVVRIERLITMYQKNAQDVADIAYLDCNTMFTLMYLRWDFRTTILTKYPRAKLADDGVRVASGQQIITPKIGKAEAISKFRAWELQGLVENIDQFKNDLQCYRAPGDPNRLEFVLPPDLMNQFRVGSVLLQFLLQSPIV